MHFKDNSNIIKGPVGIPAETDTSKMRESSMYGMFNAFDENKQDEQDNKRTKKQGNKTAKALDKKRKDNTVKQTNDVPNSADTEQSGKDVYNAVKKSMRRNHTARTDTADERPLHNGERPLHNGERPLHNGERSLHNSERPLRTNKRPLRDTDERPISYDDIPQSEPIYPKARPSDYAYRANAGYTNTPYNDTAYTNTSYVNTIPDMNEILKAHLRDYEPDYIPETIPMYTNGDDYMTRLKPPISPYTVNPYSALPPSGIDDYIPPIMRNPPDMSGGIGAMFRRFIARILGACGILVTIALAWFVFHYFGEAKICYYCGFMTHSANAITVKLSGNGNEFLAKIGDGETFNKRTYYLCDDCMLLFTEDMHKRRS